MGVLISFFKWLDKIITTVLTFLADLPGKLVAFVVSFFTAVGGVLDFISDHCSDVAGFFDDAASFVSSVGGYVSSHSVGSLLVHVLSLDVAFQYVSSVGAVFLGLLSTVFIGLFAFICTVWIIPMTFQLVQKVIAVLSAGFVKT